LIKPPDKRFREAPAPKDLIQHVRVIAFADMHRLGPVRRQLRCPACNGMGAIYTTDDDQTWAGRARDGLSWECLACQGHGIPPIPHYELEGLR
jgi:hypothetical protein